MTNVIKRILLHSVLYDTYAFDIALLRHIPYYVTSSYILCHIIIHTMSHHTRLTLLCSDTFLSSESNRELNRADKELCHKDTGRVLPTHKNTTNTPVGSL